MKQLNYFAAREQKSQERFKHQRDRLFYPIVRPLRDWGVTPDFISLCGILCLIPFGYLVLSSPQPDTIAIASVLLALHVLLDGIDGPLSRLTETDGPAGAFVDMCCDHGGMIAIVWILSGAELINGTNGNVYVTLYTIAVVFIIWLNVLDHPFQWVFRSKYLTYLTIILYGFTGINLLDEALTAFSACNAILCVVGFGRIRHIMSHMNE